jgi:hypothetical protein
MIYDIVIVDCPSETHDLLAAWSLNRADTIVMVYSGCLACAMWYEANKRALQIIQNRIISVSSAVASNFDYEGMYKILKCTPDIRIPYIKEAQLLHNENKLLIQLAGKKGRVYTKAINELYGVIQK